MSEVKTAVWGASGYAGTILSELLIDHPHVASVEALTRHDPAEATDADVAFLAIPDGPAGALAAKLRERGVSVIDLSADLRFSTASEYEQWYGRVHPAPHLLPATYALPEQNRDAIRNNPLLSMPGCYPTATLLGALPLRRAGILAPEGIISVNAESGYSGRGKNITQGELEAIEAGFIKPYNVGGVHRHVGEIEEQLGARGQVVFSPATNGQIFSGMLVRTTLPLTRRATTEDLHALYEATYADEPFVKVLEPGGVPSMGETSETHCCHIGVIAVERSNAAIVVSSQDNLRKGAASQAVQVFNIQQGFEETTALAPKA